MRSPRPGGAKFKNFPYHMGDSVEIKKIQSSKSKVQNKFCHGHPFSRRDPFGRDKPQIPNSKLLL